MWWRFQYVIKIMADIENILNDLGLLEALLIPQKSKLSRIGNENV